MSYKKYYLEVTVATSQTHPQHCFTKKIMILNVNSTWASSWTPLIPGLEVQTTYVLNGASARFLAMV